MNTPAPAYRSMRILVTPHLRSGLSRFFSLACLTEPGFVHRTIAGRLKCQLLFIRAMVQCYEVDEGVARLKNRDKPEHSMSCRENVLSSYFLITSPPIPRNLPSRLEYRFPVLLFLTAMARAFFVPTRTTRRLPLVMPV